jgi:ribose 5-phosphate isomerase
MCTEPNESAHALKFMRASITELAVLHRRSCRCRHTALFWRQPYLTDNGNYIVDVKFDAPIADPKQVRNPMHVAWCI